MDLEERMNLIMSVGEEVLTPEELKQLLETNDHPVAYDGFEPSGRAHIPFGLLRAENINTLHKAGVKFKLFLADYFAFINNKVGGDLEKIKTNGKYFIEIWKACGVDTDKVEIIWASEKMDDIDYWDKVLRVGREITLKRSLRATTIMGRTQGELQSTAQLFYPIMQVADVFNLDIDICQMGMDQRRANILAREVAPKLGWKKSVAIHHHMVLGLQGKQASSSNDEEEAMLTSKMSKSKPETCIYMHDTEEDIKRKIGKAYCPERVIEGNPIIDYCEHLIFKKYDTMLFERPAKFGGNLEIQGIAELKKVYEEGKLHPMDLKSASAKYLNEMVAPVREHFEKNKKAAELYETVKQYAITR